MTTGRVLAGLSPRAQFVRVVTIKRPPSAVDGVTQDNFQLGEVFDVSPHLAILLTAAGWVRGETRTRLRRADPSNVLSSTGERRHTLDRRN